MGKVEGASKNGHKIQLPVDLEPSLTPQPSEHQC